MVDEKFTPKSLLSCAQYLIVNIDFLCQHIQSKHIASLFNYNVATDTGEFGVIRNSMLSTFLIYPICSIAIGLYTILKSVIFFKLLEHTGDEVCFILTTKCLLMPTPPLSRSPSNSVICG